jgi:hypothetical protein
MYVWISARVRPGLAWHLLYVKPSSSKDIKNQKRGEIPMAIQKKSLIGNRAAAKKAIVATNVASTAPVSGTKIELGKRKDLAKFVHHAAKPGPVHGVNGMLAKHALRVAKSVEFAKVTALTAKR